MTLTDALNLRKGQRLHAVKTNADGTPQRWKVNGKVKVGKDGSIRIPIKRGLYQFGAITNENLHLINAA